MGDPMTPEELAAIDARLEADPASAWVLRAYAEAGMAAPPLPRTDTQCRADRRQRAGVTS